MVSSIILSGYVFFILSVINDVDDDVIFLLEYVIFVLCHVPNLQQYLLMLLENLKNT